MRSDFAALKAFCRFHGLPWPVGRIVGGPLPWPVGRAVETRENANAATLRAETERDRYRFTLIDAANDIEEIAMCRFDSSRRQSIEAALQGIRTALETTDPRRKGSP